MPAASGASAEQKPTSGSRSSSPAAGRSPTAAAAHLPFANLRARWIVDDPAAVADQLVPLWRELPCNAGADDAAPCDTGRGGRRMPPGARALPRAAHRASAGARWARYTCPRLPFGSFPSFGPLRGGPAQPAHPALPVAGLAMPRASSRKGCHTSPRSPSERCAIVVSLTPRRALLVPFGVASLPHGGTQHASRADAG